MMFFEIILLILLIPLYGIVFYVAGKANVFDFLFKAAKNKMNDSNDKQEYEGRF
jgi:hypothetical protein